MAQRRAARGSSYKAPTPKPQPKPAPQATPAPQAKPASPAPQSKPAAPAPKMGRIEKKNRARLGDERVDALKAKNAEFQAAKKSGTLNSSVPIIQNYLVVKEHNRWQEIESLLKN